MSDSLSPDEARAFRRRWAAVTARAREEQASATLEQKLNELEMLMLSVDDFGWASALDDDAPVRARWARLRERLLEPLAPTCA
ncbi:MAG: hypothetical protein ABI548_28590 [Polyangiaceae bacterium]